MIQIFEHELSSNKVTELRLKMIHILQVLQGI